MEMLWRGTLAFELVHIPIRLYKATRRRRVKFRLLHEPDLSPVRYVKYCAEEDRPIPAEEVVRGYPFGEDWVVIDEDELARAAPRLTRSIELGDFVSEHEIDPLLYRAPYYLAPDEGGEETFVLLREAIRRSRRVGLAEFVLHQREHLALVRAHGEAIVLETLHYPEEMIDPAELELEPGTRVSEGQVRLAVELIERRTRPFEPSRYRNDYRARVLELIRRKAQGELPPELEPPETPRPTPVVDLTRRLRESLERIEMEGERRAA